MAARHLSFYSSGDNSPIDSNPLVPCAAGIRYIPKVQRPVLPPNLFDCPCRLGNSCSDIWGLCAGWNFGVRPCASVNISRVWGRHAPTRSCPKGAGNFQELKICGHGTILALTFFAAFRNFHISICSQIVDKLRLTRYYKGKSNTRQGGATMTARTFSG